jgi:hypothetical protein
MSAVIDRSCDHLKRVARDRRLDALTPHDALALQTKMPNDTATEKPGFAENRDNTITRGRHGSSLTSPMVGTAIRVIKYPIDLGCGSRTRLVE